MSDLDGINDGYQDTREIVVGAMREFEGRPWPASGEIVVEMAARITQLLGGWQVNVEVDENASGWTRKALSKLALGYRIAVRLWERPLAIPKGDPTVTMEFML